jgi:hypothetical protein
LRGDGRAPWCEGIEIAYFLIFVNVSHFPLVERKGATGAHFAAARCGSQRDGLSGVARRRKRHLGRGLQRPHVAQHGYSDFGFDDDVM